MVSHRLFADEGAKVIIADIDIARATASAAAIGPSARAVKLDVTDLSEIDAVVKAVDEEFGGIDILVNNAAIFDMAPINGITEESYERVFDINLKGPLFMMKAVSNVMIARARVARSSIWRARPAVAVSARHALLRFQGRDHFRHAIGGAGARQARHQCQRHRARCRGW